MKIFFTVLIIVLVLLIAIRFIALQFYTTEEQKPRTKLKRDILTGLMIGLALCVVAFFIFLHDPFDFYISVLIYSIIALVGVFWALFHIVAHLTVVMPLVLISTGIVRKKKKPIIVAAVVWVPIYIVLIIVFLSFPLKYPLLNPGILFQDYDGIVRMYGEPTYNDGDVLCYRTEVWWYQCGYYCVKMTPNGRAYFAYYDDLYDSKWILGRSREEIDARFPKGWEVPLGTKYYRIDAENSGTYYVVEYDERGIAVSFDTDDSVP
ncbi:MAG: hypothetical protein IJ397_01105 [Lachnospiraceae bacterium]|nr:hypothetical protein [Lachnospiraceae bacterium]